MALKSSFSLKADFLSEADLLKNLNHPGIPLIYDIDEDDDYIYMIEEFIQGESLDTFVLHQRNISQELIIKLGIQLCDILDYLHHLSPYPILYQDLKPEHIILCGNQLKLIDFGIASFFTDSGNHFQIYGTDGFAAPEALSGDPITPSADIYGIGKILEFLADAANPRCSGQLLRIIRCATSVRPYERYPTVSDMKSALACAQRKTHQHSSHLIGNIAVLGSRAGAGATHIAVSLTSVLRKKGISALYLSSDKTDTLEKAAQVNRNLKEQDGVFYYDYFKGMPSYGEGILLPSIEEDCIVWDYGMQSASLSELQTSDLIFFILTGGDWDVTGALTLARQLALLPQTIFVCNYGNKQAAHEYARLLDQRVYCFPCDSDPYHVSREKERLISTIFHKEGGKSYFSF